MSKLLFSDRLRLLTFVQEIQDVSSELVVELNTHLKGLLSQIREINSIIGIVIPRRRKWIVAPIINSIVQSGHAFYCLSSGDEIPRDHLEYIISAVPIKVQGFEEIDQRGDLFLHRCPSSTTPQSSQQLLYVIRTSGSTGDPKVIRVPESCILSNITKLRERFRITADDVILNCSPPTFDPFLVDLFLATSSGASILFLEDFTKDLYANVRTLFNKLQRKCVTIMQITPSIFKGLSKSDQEFILSSNSSLRIICFGGESFPEDLLKELKWDEESKTIYNIYGITEISCWASLGQFKRDQRIDLGQPIDDEIFEVRDEGDVEANIGRLWIGSRTRKCLINKETAPPTGVLFRSTGDLVERQGSAIFYKGRIGDVIKRFGVKVNLLDLEKRALISGFGMKSAACLFDRSSQRILLFITCSNVVSINKFKGHLQNSLEVHPDEVYQIEEIPLNSHGKVAKAKLMERYLEINKQEHLILFNSYDLTKSFQANGGTSMRALQHLHSLERKGGKFPDFIGLLLNPEISMGKVMEYINRTGTTIVDGMEETGSKDSLSLSLNLTWKYDLKKCVDASPTVFLHKSEGYCVAVGSHSGSMVVLSMDKGNLIAELILPDRIESKVVIEEDNLYVGCYDGHLYNWNFITKQLNWKFNTQGMIKSEPILVGGGLIIVGSYSQEDNLVAVLKTSGKTVWSKRVGSKGILARPALTFNDKFLTISTLDGTVEILNPMTGETVTSCKLNSPVFANPISISDNLIVTEVTGVVHCFKMIGDTLEREWEFKSGGNIFQIQEFQLQSNQWNLYFGCYDNCLYKIELNMVGASLDYKRSWKVQLNSPIYARPAYDPRNKRIICCSTQGEVYAIKSDVGTVIGQLKMDGELFSSPAVQDHFLIFGCRDNYIYCLNILD